MSVTPGSNRSGVCNRLRIEINVSDFLQNLTPWHPTLRRSYLSQHLIGGPAPRPTLLIAPAISSQRHVASSYSTYAISVAGFTWTRDTPWILLSARSSTMESPLLHERPKIGIVIRSVCILNSNFMRAGRRLSQVTEVSDYLTEHKYRSNC